MTEETKQAKMQAALRAAEEFLEMFSLVGEDGPKGEAEIPYGLHTEGTYIKSPRLYESYMRLARELDLLEDP